MDVSPRLVTTLMLLPLAIPVFFLLRLPIGLTLAPALGPLVILGIFIARKARTLPEAMKFLAAYLLYNDGVQTVIAVSAIFRGQ